jgi:hypothetical protein
MAKWFGGKKDDGTEMNDEEAGKAVEAKFTALEDSNKKTNETLTTLADTIKQMNDRETAKQKAIEDAARAKSAADARKAKEEETPEDRFERFAADPNRYIAEQNEPGNRLALMTNAKLMRQETLGEKEYYTGIFKTEVDALIESEHNLATRGNPVFLENCYKIILANNFEKIQKGELRRNTSLHQFSDGSGSGTGRDNKDVKPTLEYRDQVGAPASKAKYAASQMGLTEEDIINAAKTGEIHGLEVVA